MGLGTNHVISSEVTNFIPQIWSDEIIASYKANLVYRNLVRQLNHKGKKGDTIKLPTPTRASASAKTAETQVTLIEHGTDTGLTVTINKHYEYSRLIEDFADVQALESLRRFYTDDAGYALGKQVDIDLILASIGGTLTYTAATNKLTTASVFGNIYKGDGTAWSTAAGGSELTSVDITDAGIRAMVMRLDDNNVPFAGRSLIVPTIVKQDLLGLARFSEQAFTGEAGSQNQIRSGLIGNIYAMPVYVSTQLPLVEDNGGTANLRLAEILQQDAAVLVEQLGLRVQKQYKQEYLADLMTADTIYGVKQLRSTNLVAFVVPST
jgi:N4-gp56 family major capsid protein